MLTITKLSENGLNFKRFVFLSKVNATHKKTNKFELSANIPEICPICGNKDIIGTIKIFNKGIFKIDDRTISITTAKKFINLNICKEHIYLTEINFKKENIILFSSVLFCLIYFLIFFDPLLTTIIITIGGLYSFFSSEKKYTKLRIIDENIYFNYLLEHSIISIRRSDWAEDFKKLNQCKEYKQGISL